MVERRLTTRPLTSATHTNNVATEPNRPMLAAAISTPFICPWNAPSATANTPPSRSLIGRYAATSPPRIRNESPVAASGGLHPIENSRRPPAS